MRVGVVKEIKNNENRVGLVPAGADRLVSAGHEVWRQMKKRAPANRGEPAREEGNLSAGGGDQSIRAEEREPQ